MFSNNENIKSIVELLPRKEKALFYKNNKPIRICDVVEEIKNVNSLNIRYGIDTATELFYKIFNYKIEFECVSIIGITNNKFTNYLTIDDDYKIGEYITFNGNDGTLSVDESVSPISTKYYYITGGHTRLAENKETLNILKEELVDISLKYSSLNSNQLFIDVLEHKKINTKELRSNIIIKFKIYFVSSIKQDSLIELKSFTPQKSYFYGTKLHKIQVYNCKRYFKILIKNELSKLKFGFLTFKNTKIIFNNNVSSIDIYFKSISFLTIF